MPSQVVGRGSSKVVEGRRSKVVEGPRRSSVEARRRSSKVKGRRRPSKIVEGRRRSSKLVECRRRASKVREGRRRSSKVVEGRRSLVFTAVGKILSCMFETNTRHSVHLNHEFDASETEILPKDVSLEKKITKEDHTLMYSKPSTTALFKVHKTVSDWIEHWA